MQYEEKDGVTYVTAQCDWTAPYEMPDSFTIVQWSEENYRHVTMTRKIAWTDTYFAEAFYVNGADETLPVDWVMHLKGEWEGRQGMEHTGPFSEKKPFSHFHDAVEVNRETRTDSDLF